MNALIGITVVNSLFSWITAEFAIHRKVDLKDNKIQDTAVATLRNAADTGKVRKNGKAAQYTWLKSHGYLAQIDASGMGLVGKTDLTLAAERRDIQAIRYLHALEKSLGEKDGFGNTPAAIAIENQDLDTAAVLHELHADFNGIDVAKVFPLVYSAIDKKDTAKLTLLRKLGCDMNKPYGNGCSPLRYAIFRKDEAMVRLLVLLGADLNKMEASSKTPLRYAIFRKDEAMVRLLVLLGADLNKMDASNFTSLTYAIDCKDEAMVRLLILLGADLNNIDASNSTPLTYAIDCKDEAMVRLLILLGADLNKIDTSNLTPLTYAIQCKDEAMIRLLVLLGADLNKGAASNPTPLSYAIFCKDEAMVRLLVLLGADLNKGGTPSPTPLSCAIFRKDETMIRLLVLLGADLNKMDASNHTPLSYAIFRKDEAMIRLLVLLGADLNKGGASNLTPLKYAIFCKDEAMVRLLVLLGADLNKMDASDFTSLTYAMFRKDEAMVRLLVLLGADLNKMDSEGYTPLAFALANSNRAVIKILKENDRNSHLSEEFIHRKYLAHTWGIKGNSAVVNKATRKGQSFPLEGLYSGYTIQKAAEYIKLFFHSQTAASLLFKKEEVEIEMTLESAFHYHNQSDELFVKRAQQGKPVVLMGGFFEHAIGFVSHNNKLMVCNRGLGKMTNAIEIYSLPISRITSELIHKLRYKHSNNEALRQYLDSLVLTHLGGMQQENQEVGNCAEANLMSAILALFYSVTEENDQENQRSIGERARETYKRFIAFKEEKTLDDYLNSSNNYDAELVANITEKAARNKR